MICVVFYDVIARYVFQDGSIAMQEMEWPLFAAVFLLGAAYTMREDANVRVDVFYARMHPLLCTMQCLTPFLFFLSNR